MTESSSPPANFLDLQGPPIPSEKKDRIFDELPESALPPAVMLNSADSSYTPVRSSTSPLLSYPTEESTSPNALHKYPPPSLLQEDQQSSSKKHYTFPLEPSQMARTRPNYLSPAPTFAAPRRPPHIFALPKYPSTSLGETISLRALVADDDPLTRRLMERMLKVRRFCE